jgi:hypothetical protein
MNVMRDEEFLAEIAQDRLEVRPVAGDVVQSLIEKLYSAPQPLIEHAKTIVSGR